MSDKRVIALVVVVAFAGIFGASQAGIFALTDANPTTATTMRYLGHVTAVVSDSNGNIKSYFQTDNIIVDDGRNCATDLVFGTSFHTTTCTIVDKMAIGSSSTAVGVSESTLVDETTNGKESIASSGISAATGVDPPDDDVMFTLSNTFTILVGDNDESIGETGLFDSGGNMFARALIGPFPVTTDDLITVNWDFTID